MRNCENCDNSDYTPTDSVDLQEVHDIDRCERCINYSEWEPRLLVLNIRISEENGDKENE